MRVLPFFSCERCTSKAFRISCNGGIWCVVCFKLAGTIRQPPPLDTRGYEVKP